MTTTPDQVRATRERLGLSVEALADALGVDRVTVWKWENGRRKPPPYLWRALRDIERELQTKE